MTFVVIRVAIALVLFIAAALIMKIKFRQKDKKMYLVALLCSVIVGYALFFVAVEDPFLTFPTRQDALFYVTNTTATRIIEGKSSDWVISKNDDKNTMLMVPKTEKGYKVSLGSYVVRAEQYADDNVFFNIYRFKNSNDYYMMLTDLNNGYTEITDSCNSVFQYEEVTDKDLGTYCVYYCYVDGFDKNYTVTVGGKTYSPFTK
ncbi:MAG: hypothetical protein IKV36_01515 [Clostridia bacterium]|nr:hypothetical protein [Clostridia bacterium]